MDWDLGQELVPWRSGLERVVIGVFATLVTYGIGSLFHV